jgi:hypothetical protein
MPDFAELIEARADLVRGLAELLEALHGIDGQAVAREADDLEDAVERAVEAWRRSPLAITPLGPS